MQDIREHSEDELSLWVLNTEYLYHACLNANDNEGIREILDKEFLYTEIQFHELLNDLLSQ